MLCGFFSLHRCARPIEHSSVSLCLRTERIHKPEKIREVHRAVAVQVEARVIAAVRIGEEEEIDEIDPAIAIEIGRGLARCRPRRHILQQNRTVLTPACQGLSIRTKRYAPDRSRMPGECANNATCNATCAHIP